jgi:hypothetical protein
MKSRQGCNIGRDIIIGKQKNPVRDDISVENDNSKFIITINGSAVGYNILQFSCPGRYLFNP